MGSTKGAWLRGDPRGWRSRHHREHVQGDYKHPPPPGAHDVLLKQSRRLMQRPPGLLTWPQRVVACMALAEKLTELGAEVIEASVTRMHMHVLVRFTPLGMTWREHLQSPGMAVPGLCAANSLQDGRDPIPRHCIGIAKKHASHRLREEKLGVAGGIWAVRSKVLPIESRKHQVHVARYIREHHEEGGAILSMLRRGAQSRDVAPAGV